MKTYQYLIVIFLMVSGQLQAAAPLSNANNSDFYYEIGGARSIALPPNVNVQTVQLGGATEIGLGYSCGKFDPTLGLSNLLNGLSNAGNNLINGAIGAVTAAIGSLPALVMQRIDPGLYDLFQNALIRAEATLSLANKSCEQYEQEISKGKNPYAEWTKLAKTIDWKVQMGTGGSNSSQTDVVQAKKNVESNNGSNGINWIGGARAGGNKPGQKPIKVTHDVVQAGYNITLNRNITDTSAPSGGANQPRLLDLWQKPSDASKWAVEVLGDTEILTYDNHPSNSTPGNGLIPKIGKKTAQIEQDLMDLVTGTKKPTIANLEKVSNYTGLITKDVIDAIKTLNPSEQAIAISKLASESAMADVMEKALAIRRLLITGAGEPNIKVSAAQTHIDKLVAELDREINDILFERRVHKELMSETARTLLNLRAAHKAQAEAIIPAAGSEDKLIKDGAVQP